MDASGSKGLGGIFEDQWYSSRCPCCFRTRDIQFKEVYAVLQAILRWGHLWWGHHIIFHVDNSAMVSALSLGTIQNAQVMNILRWIVMLAAWLGSNYSSSWLILMTIFLLMLLPILNIIIYYQWPHPCRRSPACHTHSYVGSNICSPVPQGCLLPFCTALPPRPE